MASDIHRKVSTLERKFTDLDYRQLTTQMKVNELEDQLTHVQRQQKIGTMVQLYQFIRTTDSVKDIELGQVKLIQFIPPYKCVISKGRRHVTVYTRRPRNPSNGDMWVIL